MGATPVYALPYPEATDPADVPVDMRELAERIEAVMPAVPAWTEITVFSSGWVNFDAATEETAGYRKEPGNVIRMKGLIKSGTGAAITTLPVGYRPRRPVRFLAASGSTGQADRVEINAAGAVTVPTFGTGAQGYLDLSMVEFVAI